MSVADNIAQVKEQMAAACHRSGRALESVELMAVSKNHPPEAMLEAFASGLRIFGENRVQEYARKLDLLQDAKRFSNGAAKVHCIGHLQSNKVRRAVEIFDGIDTVDSLGLAQGLNQAAVKLGKKLPVLIEIKIGTEESKHGLTPDGPELAPLLERMANFQHLELCGLMTVPPFAEDPEQVRPYFRQLRVLRENLSRAYPNLKLDELSMGMSHDFQVAIEEGATVVRIGTAIFGVRPSR